ncbi:glycosyltransferase family 2 protein [Natronosalvus caseinilyticus]|uniref:glycosyltransferase family 2 protein n=1 Tax=Natronosalvus caseinilyticus TaxID=2953747 RepID=UPI0028B1C73D|nr:glycosyltransferase family 2 protein [Natronosalvus caseinilyticus]
MNVLPRAIDSVLEQSMGDLELIIIDDCSTDNTKEVIKSYTDDRVTYVRLDKNMGANAARNKGIKESEGDIVAFLDSDDQFEPNYLGKVLNQFDSRSNRCIGTYSSRIIYKDGDKTNVTIADQAIKYEEILVKNKIGGFSNTAFRRRIFEEVGYLDEEMSSSQDYDFFIRALQPDDYLIQPIRDAYIGYHIHDQGETRIGANLQKKIEGQNRLLEKHRDKFPQAGIANQYYQRGMAHARSGNMGAARFFFWKGLRTNPRSWRHWYHLFASFGGRYGIQAASWFKKTFKRLFFHIR